MSTYLLLLEVVGRSRCTALKFFSEVFRLLVDAQKGEIVSVLVIQAATRALLLRTQVKGPSPENQKVFVE